LKKITPHTELPNRNVSIQTGSWHPIEQMRRQFEHLFHEFPNMPSLLTSNRRFDAEPFWNAEYFRLQSPAVDIVENEKSFLITAEVPGVDEKQLSVKIVNGTLQIKGEKQQEHEEKSNSYHLTERRYGSFERVFTLPKSVDADGVKASFKAGVLSVTMPKKADAMKPEKEIDIAID
jgi:HSP20 family protein